jgi:hypothetical protein
MASMGIDPDKLENPKQEIPPVQKRIDKMRRYVKDHHPRSKEYKEKLQVYELLQNPKQEFKQTRSIWKSLFGG